MGERGGNAVVMHAILGLVASAIGAILLVRVQAQFGLGVVALVWAAGEAILAIRAAADRPNAVGSSRSAVRLELRDMVGARGVVTRDCRPRGQVRVNGESWQAKSADEYPLDVGTAVCVVGATSLVLDVKAASDA